jgi:hypothetical protein
MTFLEIYIFFIFLIKLIFIILAITNLYLNKQIPVEEKENQENKKTDKIKKQIELREKIENWKKHIELLFKFTMSILLIYIFSPRYNRVHLINYEAKLLFFLFGIILIVTAQWKEIINESPFLVYIQNILRP